MNQEMIVSHKHKFIFIKTLKTAGTAVECWLNPYLGKTDIVTPIYPLVNGHRARNYRGTKSAMRQLTQGNYSKANLLKLIKRKEYWNHMSAQQIKARVGEEVWNTYYKFCIERNPWDKVISQFFMITKRDGLNISLKEYLEMPYVKVARNFERYTDEEKEVCLDKVIDYYSIASELDQFGERFQIPTKFSDFGRIKSNYGRKGKDYREIYSPNEIERVKEIFADEIRMWSYEY